MTRGAEVADARAAQQHKDRRLLAALETVRLRTNDEFDYQEIDKEYAAAFDDYGLDLDENAGAVLRAREPGLERRPVAGLRRVRDAPAGQRTVYGQEGREAERTKRSTAYPASSAMASPSVRTK